MLLLPVRSHLKQVLLGLIGLFTSGVFLSAISSAADKPPTSIEYRDTNPSIDTVDSIRVLSTSKAKELEREVVAAYVKLAPSVVRFLSLDERGEVKAGGFTGVIIDPAGLILTCAHHDIAPQTVVKIELSDGSRVAGKMLGRFDDQGRGRANQVFSPDLGLAAITEGEKWPAVVVDQAALPADRQTCLAIGYPGTLPLGRPPLLRAGHVVPTFPDWHSISATTTSLPGDSGGPLFDLRGRLLGILSGPEGENCRTYYSILPLKEHQVRLQAGELVSAPLKGYRALRGHPAISAPFTPALDLEDRVQQLAKSVIQIMDGSNVVASGLIVDSEGWAVTKASLIGSRETWTCRVFYVRQNKSFFRCKVVATSPEHDVALLKLDLAEWFPIAWSNKDPQVGTFVAAVLGQKTTPLKFAVVGARATPEYGPKHAVPMIPISMKAGEADTAAAPVLDVAGWRTAEFDVYRDLLEEGDIICQLNGIPTPTRADFAQTLDRLIYAPQADGKGVNYQDPLPTIFHGDWVTIGLRRGARELTVSVPRVHSVTEGALMWHSHPLSLRRESFPTVFPHDCALRPEQCGGPVVDLDGKVIGLNIARADETRTLAIPADVVQTLIQNLKKQAARKGK